MKLNTNYNVFDKNQLKEYVQKIASGQADDWTFEEFPLLCQAVILDDMESAEILIEHGADVNEQDAYGYSPLSHAKTKEWLGFLKKYGAQFDLTNGVSGFSILHEAVSFGKVDLIETLIANGVDMYSPCALPTDKKVPYSIAYTPPFSGMKLAPSVLIRILEEFKKCGYDISGVDGDYSLLHACVFTVHPMVAGWLVDNGANTKIKDSQGYTPMEYLKHLLENGKEWMFMGYDYSSCTVMEGMLEHGTAWFEFCDWAE